MDRWRRASRARTRSSARSRPPATGRRRAPRPRPRSDPNTVVPAHSASLRAFTPVFDGLWTRVNALVLGTYIPEPVGIGPRFRGDDGDQRENGQASHPGEPAGE